MTFANTNPNFYQTDEDDPSSPSGKRRLIFSTLDSLLVAQTGSSTDKVLAVPATSNLTIHATHLTLVGKIVLHGGDVKIVCRTLHVVEGAPATIDVSGTIGEGYDRPGDAPPAAPLGATGKAADGSALAQQKATAGKFYGRNGQHGGSIEIICDEIDLGDALTLDASGSIGYPGHDGQHGAPGTNGQDGVIRHVCVFPGSAQGGPGGSFSPARYEDRVEQVAHPGNEGQTGGDALKGGDGGSAGSVTVRHAAGTAKEPERLIIRLDYGPSGIPGAPGKGGKRGRGGTTTLYDAGEPQIRGQEYPQNDVDGPYAPDGTPPGKAEPGARGTRHVAHKPGDLRALGQRADSLFFNIYFQSIRLRYVNCSPRLFKGTQISFRRGSLDEWKAIVTDTDWLVNALGEFMDASEGMEALRKANLFALAAGLQTRQQSNKTVFNKRPTWVSRETFESLGERFKTSAQATKSLEAAFWKLAENYKNRNVDRLDAKSHQSTLVDTRAAYLEAYNKAFDAVGAAKTNVEAATSALNTARVALTKAQNKLVEGLKQFHCNIDMLLKSAEMMAFCHGSAGMAVGMGMVQLFGIINEGTTKIPTNEGGSVDNRYFIHRLVKLGDDLQGEMETKIQDGLGTLGDGKTPTYLARIDQLDDLIDQVSNAAGDDAVDAKRAVQDYRNALVDRSDAVLDYNATVLTAGQYYQEYKATADELQAVLGKKQEITPYDRQIFSGYARRYQQQVEVLLETLDALERKLDFLTLGGEESFDKLREEWLACWYDRAPPEHDTTTFLSELSKMQTALASDSASKNPANPFPDEAEHTVVLSETRARLPADLVKTLKDEGQVTFTLVPESTKTLRPGEVHVIASAGMYDLRVSTVRPHLVGVKTKTKVVRVGITCEGDSRIDDVRTTDVYRFHHDSVDTTFDHFTAFVEPAADEIYKPVRSGHAGKFTGGVLDMVGLFGRWTLWLPPGSEGDYNEGLDRSGVTDVIIYFKGFFRDRRPT